MSRRRATGVLARGGESPPTNPSTTARIQAKTALKAAVTLDTTPTVGNMLIAAFASAYAPTGSAGTPAPPSGWTTAKHQWAAGDTAYVAYRVVQSGDGTGPYTFGYTTMIGSANYAVTVEEWVGLAGTVNTTGGTTGRKTGQLTSSSAHCLLYGAVELYGSGTVTAASFAADTATTAVAYATRSCAGPTISVLDVGVATCSAEVFSNGTYGAATTLTTSTGTADGYVGAIAAFVAT